MSTERLANQLPSVWPKNRLLCTFFLTYGLGGAMQGLWRCLHRVLIGSLAFASAGRAHRALPISKIFPQNTTPAWRRIFPNNSARRIEKTPYGALIHPKRSPLRATKVFGASLFLSSCMSAGRTRPCRQALSALRLVLLGLDSVYRKSFLSLASSGDVPSGVPVLFSVPGCAQGLSGEQFALSEGG